MMYLLIGSIIGLVMGLTGAGGALVAIPLFMQFLHLGLKEASVYSLLTVVFASLSNFYHQRQRTDYKLGLNLVISSAMGSFFSRPFKHLMPDLGIALILAFISLYSLYAVWKAKPESQVERVVHRSFFLTVGIGLILGILATLTGLGGGVLLLPVMVSFYKKDSEAAVASSLFVIGLSSLASFLIQIRYETSAFQLSEIFQILIGIFVISYSLKFALDKLPLKTTDKLRKVVFSLVVFISLAKIF